MLRILNVASILFMLVLNYLAVALPLNGKSTGALSDQYPNLFVPAGITFSIWGIIYLSLIIFVVSQFFHRYHKSTEAIGNLFIINGLLNGGWIVAWHYEQVSFSLFIIVGLLMTLIAIAMKIKSEMARLHQFAFGIYLGWILVATIANATALLVHYHWNGWGLSPLIWTLILLVIGSVITTVSMYKFNNVFIVLPVIWAFIGIAIKRQNDYPAICWFSVSLTMVLTFIALVRLWRISQSVVVGSRK
jgi:hypothetical protein